MYVDPRILGGLGCYWLGACGRRYNLVHDLGDSRPKQYEEPVIHAAPLSKDYHGDPKKPESRLHRVA